MITTGYIMKLVKEYAKTPEGKAAIKEKYGITYVEKNPSKLLKSYGEQMKTVLYKHISGVISSLTLSDIIVESPTMDENGLWTMNIGFNEAALHRESLDSEYFPHGISNIVLLFTKGYSAKNYVYGTWKFPDGGSRENVRSRKEREGDAFLLRAVQEFNTVHGKDIARAELVGAYEEAVINRK